MLRAAAVKDIKEKNKMVRQTARAVYDAKEAFAAQCAKNKGYHARVQRLLRKAKPWEAWDLETGLHEAETKAREAPTLLEFVYGYRNV